MSTYPDLASPIPARSRIIGFRLTAGEAASALSNGRISSEELVRSCLRRVSRLERTVQAWAYLDSGLAIRRAQAADSELRDHGSRGPLHGVPIGVKDIFDTSDMPTEYGTPLHTGHRPARDATVVYKLRQAGAIVLGKTVTSELASYHPGKTRNPHNPEHTPGGSSMGSAAAVAAHMVPVAVGSQTNGSIIRPASYCGVFGFKPTAGMISRYGVLQQSEYLDQIGVFGRSLEDIALLAETLIGADKHDARANCHSVPELLSATMRSTEHAPRVAFVKSPVWSQADDSTRSLFQRLAAELRPHVEELELPTDFNPAMEWHRTIMEADMARNYAVEFEQGAASLSPVLRAMIERGRACSVGDYNGAVDAARKLGVRLDEILSEYQAILTPATTGEAPPRLDTTGSPVFCSLWTLCGVPAISVPLLSGPNGLPVGVQLVARRLNDAGLLKTARWLTETIAGEDRWCLARLPAKTKS